MVTTLAGDCVCCSSKHALTRMLLDFCRNSPAPVFIEATGVARTMNLVEKLINAQIFNKYELMQSFYVIDAHEILCGIEPAHEDIFIICYTKFFLSATFYPSLIIILYL